MKREYKGSWINANERLPMINGLRRVIDVNGKNRVAYFDYDRFVIADQPLDVVAWRQVFRNEKGRKV